MPFGDEEAMWGTTAIFKKELVATSCIMETIDKK